MTGMKYNGVIMGIVDVFAEKVADYVANDFFNNFKGHIKCMECGKVFPNEKTLLEHECAVKKIKNKR